MDKLAEIKRLYHETTAATIARDLARAVEILKSMDTEAERERAAVYMDGLSQMRSEWGTKTARGKAGERPRGGARPRRHS